MELYKQKEDAMTSFQSVNHKVYYKSCDRVEAIQPFEKVVLNTSAGPLVPVYKTDDHGRRKLMPVRYSKLGKIKSVPLQDVAEVKTSIGLLSAELITFYESGALCRLFPLNGKLSGYWSEQNEYELAQLLNIPIAGGSLSVKPIYLHFYETGELKSITFWPRERVLMNTPAGEVFVKRGVSFHSNGAVESFEPSETLGVNTPFGVVRAFDPDPSGMNGEKNSLAFDDQGNLLRLATIDSKITVEDRDYGRIVYEPELVPAMCSDSEMVRKPLYIEIEEDALVFRHGFRIIGRTSLSNKIISSPYTTTCRDESQIEKSCS